MNRLAPEIPGFLKALGVTHVVISPGSRSAPLTLAIERSLHFTLHVQIDERSAGFLALGIAQVRQQAVALVCTSGSALSNYFPAVIEAHYRNIPLIVVSADRPENLIGIYDGQAIDQDGFYGKYATASATFSEMADPQALVAYFNEIQHLVTRGPIHINCRFNEPLYQLEPAVLKWPDAPQTKEKNARFDAHDHELIDHLQAAQQPVMIIGQLPPNALNRNHLTSFIQQFPMPVFADASSQFYGIGGLTQWEFHLPKIAHGYKPDLMLHIGYTLASKSLKKWIKSFPDVPLFQLNEHHPFNAFGGKHHALPGPADDWLKRLINTVSSKRNETWSRMQQALVDPFKDLSLEPGELTAAYAVYHQLPKNGVIHLGNSMPIRWPHWVGMTSGLTVFSNRGASGIDGIVSTAIGSALADEPYHHVLICGDLSFLYDANAFWLNPLPKNLKIVVFNNRGGGIFRLIDGAKDQPERERLFSTFSPQSILSQCERFRLKAQSIKASACSAEFMKQFFSQEGLTILEIESEPEADMANFSRLNEVAKNYLGE